MADNNFAKRQKTRFPYVIVLFAVLGIIAVISKGIVSWGNVKIFPSYIAFVMNAYLYISIINFAIKGYRNETNAEKKPYKNMVFKFCMMQLMAIISLRMGNIWYLVFSGIALLFAFLVYTNVPNYDRNKIFIIIVAICVFIAAIIKTINPLGDSVSIAEQLQTQASLLDCVEMYIPESGFIKYAFIYDTFSQVIQWFSLGGVYLFRYSQFVTEEK